MGRKQGSGGKTKAKTARKRAQKPSAKRGVAKQGAAAARAARLAAGVVAGHPVSDLARAEGLSRQHTSKLVNGTEVRHIITDLVNSDYERVQRFWLKLLDRMDEALDACTFAVSKLKEADGSVIAEPVLVGPDHYARMAAGKLFVTAVCAGRAQPKPLDARDLRPTLTLEQLDEMLRQAEQEHRELGDTNMIEAGL